MNQIRWTWNQILQLADDTCVFVGSPDSINPIFDALQSFQSLSGLKANLEKTKFHNIGFGDFSKESMKGCEFSKGNIELLGVTITKDAIENETTNCTPRVKTIENILKHWSQRKLSLKGKIVVINALALSIIVYPSTVIDVPIKTIEEVNRLLYNFLWDGKRLKRAAKVIESSIKLGGLRMPNIFLKVKAWQLTWLKRAVLKPHSTWVLINNEMLKSITFPEVISNQMNLNSRVFGKLPICLQNYFAELVWSKTIFQWDNHSWWVSMVQQIYHNWWVSYFLGTVVYQGNEVY